MWIMDLFYSRHRISNHQEPLIGITKIFFESLLIYILQINLATIWMELFEAAQAQ